MTLNECERKWIISLDDIYRDEFHIRNMDGNNVFYIQNKLLHIIRYDSIRLQMNIIRNGKISFYPLSLFVSASNFASKLHLYSRVNSFFHVYISFFMIIIHMMLINTSAKWIWINMEMSMVLRRWKRMNSVIAWTFSNENRKWEV